MADDTLSWDLVARDRGASRTIKGVGDAAERAGDQMEDAGDGAGHLSTQIDEATGRLRALGEEFDRTGNKGLLKDIARERRTLSGLQRLRTEMAGLADETARVGVELGASTSQGLSLSIRNLLPAMGPALATAGAPIALGLTTLIGGAVAGGITAGITGGAIAAGIAGASRDPAVQRAWSGLTVSAEAAFSDFSLPFVRPTVEAIGEIRSAINDVRGDLSDVGEISSQYLGPLSRGIGGLIREVTPGLRELAADARPVFEMLERNLPEFGVAFRQFFESVGDGAEGGSEALEMLLDIAKVTIVGTGEVLQLLGEVYDKAQDVITFMSDRGAWIAERVAESAPKALIRVIDDTTQAAQDNAEAVREMNDAWNEYLGLTLDAERAADDLRLALLEVGDQVVENGRKLDDNTEGGLRNQQMVRDLIDSANDLRQAEIDRAGGTEEAVARANAAYEANIAKIIEVGTKAGLSRQELVAMVGPYSVDVFLNDQRFYAQLRAMRAVVGGMAGLAIDIYANLAGARGRRFGGVSYARNGLINLSGQAFVASGGPPLFGFAEPGTNGEAFVARNAPRQRSLAIGAEAMSWHGAAVVPYEQMGRGGGTTTIAIESGGSRLDDLLVEVLRKSIRVRGGNVQLVLGGR